MSAPAPKQRLLCWGANSYGQLGLGHASEQEEAPTEAPWPPDLDGVAAVAGGGGHSALLDLQGRLWTCGWNHKGQCGRQPAQKQLPNWGRANDGPADLSSVACGWDCTLAVTRQGAVLGCGSNAFGQLGIGGASQASDWTPVPLPDRLRKVVRASCGLRHSVFLGKDGLLFGAGCGKKGQLGPRAEADRRWKEVAHIELPEPVADVSCGQYFTVALGRNGAILAFGDDKFGQVSGPGVHLEPVVGVAAGWTHVYAHTSSGRLLAWGRNSYGQLGHSEEGPAFVGGEGELRAKTVSAGSEHCLAVLADGSVATWGWNEHGNCGNGGVEDVRRPGKILEEMTGNNEVVVLAVAASSAHNFVVLQEV